MDEKSLTAAKTAIIKRNFELLDNCLVNETQQFSSEVLYWAIDRCNKLVKSKVERADDFAVKRENEAIKKVVRILLNHGASVNEPLEKPLRGSTIFGFALFCRFISPDVIQLMLQYGADLTAKSFDYVPCQLAFNNGSNETIRFLLDGAITADHISRYDLLHLYLGSSTQDAGVLSKILRQGADVNGIDRHGYSVLNQATLLNDLKLARLLIDNGADVNGINGSGKSELEYAVKVKRLEIVEYFLELGADMHLGKVNPLCRAIDEGTRKIFDLLLKFGASIDGRAGDSAIPIDVAASAKKEKLVEILWNHGAKIFYSTLKLFLEWENVKFVKLSLNRGFDANFVIESKTALSYAVAKGNEELVALLLDCGAQVDGVTDDDGKFPIDYAAERGNDEIVRLLMDRGARRDNDTLWYAIRGNSAKVVKLLLDRGFDANCIVRSRTALFWAVIEGNSEIITLLFDYGAQLHKTTGDEKSAIFEIAKRWNSKITELLVANQENLMMVD